MNDKNIQDPKAMNALKGALISFLEFLRDLSKKAEHFSVYGPDIERLSKLLKEEQEVQIKTGIEVYEQGKSIVENEKNIDKCSENIVEIDEKLLEIEQCLKDALILNSMNAQEYMIDMIENNPHETDWIFVPIKEESKDVFYMYNLTLLNKPTKEQELINSNGIIKIVLTKNNEFIIDNEFEKNKPDIVNMSFLNNLCEMSELANKESESVCAFNNAMDISKKVESLEEIFAKQRADINQKGISFSYTPDAPIQFHQVSDTLEITTDEIVVTDFKEIGTDPSYRLEIGTDHEIEGEEKDI